MSGPEAQPFLDSERAPAPYAPPSPKRTVVYRGACLIDGTGAPARTGMAVVVRGERIAAVMPEGEVGAKVREVGEVVDLDGAYLLPGLIDSHQHLATPPNRAVAEALLERQVRSGITAVRDMADDLRQVAELARAALVGEIAGPDIRYAALVAGPTFFDDPRTLEVSRGGAPGAVPWMQAIRPDTDLGIAVAMVRGTGASAIKVYANLEAPEVARIVAEAHRQGLRVWAHAGVFPAMPADVIAAGVDAVSHADLLAYHGYEGGPRTYLDGRTHRPRAYERFLAGGSDALDGLLETMARRGTLLDATASLTGLNLVGQEAAVAAMAREVTVRVVRRAAAMGVALSAGTDYETVLDDPFPSLFQELRFLAGPVGLSPDAVIRAATAGGARAIGESETMGTVEAGKLANLLVVSEDPRVDIDHLRSIVFTVKRGRRFDRAAAAGSADGPGRG